MTPLLADACFDHDLLRALLRRQLDLDVITAQSLGFDEADDRDLLEWAARHGRVVLTHDVNSLAGFAYERIRGGLPMPGVIEVRVRAPWARLLEDLLLLVTCATVDELRDTVHFVPLQ